MTTWNAYLDQRKQTGTPPECESEIFVSLVRGMESLLAQTAVASERLQKAFDALEALGQS